MSDLQLKPQALIAVHAEGIDLLLGEGRSIEARAVAKPAPDDGVEKRRAFELSIARADQNLGLRPAAVVKGLASTRGALEDLGREVEPLELRRMPRHQPTVTASIWAGGGGGGGGGRCRQVVVMTINSDT